MKNEDEFKLSRPDFEEIQSKLSGYELGQIFSASQIIRILSRAKINLFNLIDYSHDIILSSQLTESLASDLRTGSKYMRPCPDCGYEILNIDPVNDSNCRMVGGNYKSVIWCSDILECGYEFYTEELMEDLIETRNKDKRYVKDLKRLSSIRKYNNSRGNEPPNEDTKPDEGVFTRCGKKS